MITVKYPQQSRKKRKVFSRKKLMQGGQMVNINSLETHVYVNLTVSSPNTIVVQNITNPLVQNVATNTPGSVILNVDPSLSTLKDYTIFAYNGTTWVEIARNNLDMGGNTVALYGNVTGMIIRKQSGSQDRKTSVEISIPVPVSAYGNIMQFVNIATSVFPFTLNSSAETYNANMYIQLIFSSEFPTMNTKISGWIPKYIPGLKLWLNASEPGNNTFTPNTGVKMTAWTDKSGNNSHAIAQMATAPMYKSLNGGVGMGMYFNGSTFFSGIMNNTENISYTFIVARPDLSNTSRGRILSLSAPNVDDSSSRAYMGVSATSGIANSSTRVVVMGLGNNPTSTSSPPNSIKYSLDNGTTWNDATSGGWTGSCCSISYGAGIFVAVGDAADVNGTIQYSRDGMNWNAASTGPTSNTGNYGFFYNANNYTGGIRVVLYTGFIWVCGGVDVNTYMGDWNSPIPAIGYSYDGITWHKGNLPSLAGSQNCISSIATDGTLIIATGTISPSMIYSYDGINWTVMPVGVKTATQFGDINFTGVHSIAYDSFLKLWIAGGEGGNTGTPVATDKSKKILWSSDGFKWNPIGSTDTDIIGPNFTAQTSIRRIFTLIYNKNPVWILSGQYLNNRSTWGPIFSRPDSSAYGFSLTHNCNSFPTYGSQPAEVSAVYISGTKIYYGLQNPSNGKFLISSTAFDSNSWPTTSSITYPVNAIVDNTNIYTKFKANIHLNNLTTSSSTADLNNAKPYIISAWADGMNSCVAINGTLIPETSANASRFDISSYMLGNNNNRQNAYIGYIYEVIVYNSLVYSRSRFAIEGYLAWKWGIQSFLPTSHLYYNNPPSKYAMNVSWPIFFSDLQPTLWLDAQDPNANESFSPKDRTFIGTWYDKSGNNNNLTAAPGCEPMYTTNIIAAGGLQFNRYAYQSMSYIPVPLATDRIPLANTANSFGTGVNTPSDWIPGFGGFSWELSNNGMPAAFDFDIYGFVYMGICSSSRIQLIQYDEENNRTRILYSTDKWTLVRAMKIGPKSGCIYLAVERWGNADSNINPIVILIPESTPITVDTRYSTVINPRIVIDGTQRTLYGAGGFVIDSDENLYFNVYSDGSPSPYNFFPYVQPTSSMTTLTSTRNYPQTFVHSQCWAFYSSKDNSISYMDTEYNPQFSGRWVMYLDSLASFKASISTTNITRNGVSGYTLTVEEMISGVIQIGSRISIIGPANADNPYRLYYTILFQMSGTDGGVGVYALNNSPAAVSSGTTITSIYIVAQMTKGSINTNTLSYDGLLNPSATWDHVAGSNSFSDHNGKVSSYDPISNCIFTNRDSGGGAYISRLRVKRINLKTRQVVTVAGSINNVTPHTTVNSIPIVNEKFPLEYGNFYNSSEVVYDTPLVNSSQYSPYLIGKTNSYFVTKVISHTTFSQVLKVTNFRANSSCMSGQINLSGPNVSVFIVYLNKNTSKRIMPHNAIWKTPLLSLSSMSGACVFKGSIQNTKLTVSEIVVGRIELGATINTPLGGYIVSFTSGTNGGVGVYTVSIYQNVVAGTSITTTNGTDTMHTGNYGANGPSLHQDTKSSEHISLYTTNSSYSIYRNNLENTSTTPTPSKEIPSSGISAVFVGSITGRVLTVESIRTGIVELGSILNIPGSPKIIQYNTTTTYGGVGTYTIDLESTVSRGTIMRATLPPIGPDILFYSSTPSNITSRLNGMEKSATTGTFTPLNITSIGLGTQPSNASIADALLPNYFFDGTICEVIVYNTDFSTDTLRQQIIEGYLAWKWGSQNKLPYTHAFKNLPPNEYIPLEATSITSSAITNITDYSIAIAWSGGDNAISYTYTMRKVSDNSQVTNFSVIDTGLKGKKGIIYGLAPRTAYILKIAANNIIGSKSIELPVSTKFYEGRLWAGQLNVQTSISVPSLTGPATNSTFYNIRAVAFDKYNNLYLCQAYMNTSAGRKGIFVITPNGSVQEIPTEPLASTIFTDGHTGRGAMNIDSNGSIYLSVNRYVYKLTPNQFPFVMNSSNIITTKWAITLVIGNGVQATETPDTGLATNARITSEPSLLFGNNIPFPCIADMFGYIRKIVDNGDGTLNLELLDNTTMYYHGQPIGTGFYYAWNDSANIYVASGGFIKIYNIKSNTVYSIHLHIYISYVVIDKVGNFYMADGNNGVVYKINMANVDLNNSTAVLKVFNDFLRSGQNGALPTYFIKFNENTLSASFAGGATPNMPSFFHLLCIDSDNNLYVVCQSVNHFGNYDRTGTIFKFTLT